MRSSTSSSDNQQEWPDLYWKRPIPTAHWQGVSLLTVLLVVGFFINWETYWRMQGYEPSYEETAELWSRHRDTAASGNRNEVVTTGSSRLQFDFDLDVWEQYYGGPRPIVLAKVGTNPRPFLSDIAKDPGFNGLIIVGVTSTLFFSPDPAPPALSAIEYLDHHKKRSWSQKTEHLLSVPIQSAFASINKDDLTLSALIRKKWFPMENREEAYILPAYPPYFGKITSDRRYHMWRKCELDPVLQDRIQQIWLPWWNMGPPFGGEGLDQLIASVKGDVELIKSRGGRVLFVRPPSSDLLRQIERERWPREQYWDRLLAETGAPGIHFEDYPQLNQFSCPEWSHLSRTDAVIYTRELVGIIRSMDIFGQE